MIKRLSIRIIVISLLAISTFSSCENKIPNKEKDSFSFVFITDIHLQPEKNAPVGFKQAIDSINKLNPDFVLTGGDHIMDALGQSYSVQIRYIIFTKTLRRNLKCQYTVL